METILESSFLLPGADEDRGNRSPGRSANNNSNLNPATPDLGSLTLDVLKTVESGDTPSIIQQFLPVLPTLQEMLLGGPAFVKQAGIILKSVTSHFLQISADELRDLAPSDRQAVFLHRGPEAFKTFWNDFFDLYEIFDEKQSHIVEPFLSKLKASGDLTGTVEGRQWLRFLVLKLLHHDNRVLAREGLTIYLDSCEKLVVTNDLDFVQSHVFPVLKDRVGWILPTAAELHQVAHKLATVCSILKFSDDDPKSCSMSLEYIKGCETSLSPVATYFFALSGCDKLESGSSNHISPSEALKLLNFILTYRLNAMDRYLKVKIHQLFAQTLQVLQPLTGSGPKSVQNSDLVDLKQTGTAQTGDLLHLLLTFVGLLSPEVFRSAKIREFVRELAQSLPEPVMSDLPLRGLYRSCSTLYDLTPLTQLFESQFSSTWHRDDVSKISEHLLALIDSICLPGSHKPDRRISAVLFAAITKVIAHAQEDTLGTAETIQLLSPISRLSSNYFSESLDEPQCNCLLSQLRVENFTPATAAAVLLLLGHAKDQVLAQLVEDWWETQNSAVELLCSSAHRIRHTDRHIGNELTSSFLRLKLLALTGIWQRSLSRGQVSVELSRRVLDTAVAAALEDGSAECFPTAVLLLNLVLQNCATVSELRGEVIQLVTDRIESIWKAVMELQKSEYFVDALNAFAGLISSPVLGQTEILSQYSERIFQLCDNMPGMALLLSENQSRRLTELSCDFEVNYLEDFVAVNVKAACFGSAIPKSGRLTFLIWEYLCEVEEDTEVNYDPRLSLPFNGSPKSRLIAILNILQFLQKDDHRLGSVITKLVEMNEEDAAERRRYFSGSQVHRYKQRIVQFLLMLQPRFDLELSRRVLEALVTALGRDGPQASVRYLTEWILIRILLKFPQLQDAFFEMSKEFIQLRPGYGCLFATTAMHTALAFGSDVNDAFLDSTLNILTGLLMGQNFTVRIYGNICFRRIFEDVVMRRNLTSLIAKYQIVYDCAKEAVATAAGNFRRIYDQVANDFYLKNFLPVDHFYLEVIFCYLPRLGGMMPADETIHVQDLRSIMKARPELDVKAAPFDVLSCYQTATQDGSMQMMKSNNSIDGREYGEEENASEESSSVRIEGSSLVQFQVKVKPWKYLPSSEDLADFTEALQLKKREAREDGLVVVASLIDRIPNLGGLCRTCEVFGASKLVISSLKILDDPQFRSMSVSAHRWLDILEVPGYELQALLSTYGRKGYTVVAAEQALDSRPLQEFKFPKKTLLLLGNEKYGIPTELLNLVDRCVEIPQVGLIRSLNVHVTGALFIWQYAAQHLF